MVGFRHSTKAWSSALTLVIRYLAIKVNPIENVYCLVVEGPSFSYLSFDKLDSFFKGNRQFFSLAFTLIVFWFAFFVAFHLPCGMCKIQPYLSIWLANEKQSFSFSLRFENQPFHTTLGYESNFKGHRLYGHDVP
jgi:hypothetical protein